MRKALSATERLGGCRLFRSPASLCAILLIQPIVNLGGSFDAAFAQVGQHEEMHVKIVMRTLDGAAVDVPVKRREVPGDWTDPIIVNHGRGYIVVQESKCDNSVRYRLEFVTPALSGPRELPCSHPEVIFAELQHRHFVLNRAFFSDNQIWEQILGYGIVEGDIALNFVKSTSEQIVSSLENEEYGTLAMIGTDLSHIYRAAGREEFADIFYSLAIESAAMGVLQNIDEGGDVESLVRYSPDTGRSELTSEGMEIVKVYQSEILGIREYEDEFGQIGWQTMNALPGADMMFDFREVTAGIEFDEGADRHWQMQVR